MRIGVDARYLNGEYSGIACYSENLLTQLSVLDQENEYEVFIHPGHRRPLNLGENFKIHTFPARPVSLATLWGLGRKLNRLNLDMLHSHFPLAPITFDGPLLVTVHDLQALAVPEFTGRRPWPVRKAYDLFYNWAYPTTIKRAKYTIAVSRATRDDVAAYFPAQDEQTVAVLSGLEDEYWEPVDPELEAQALEKHALPAQYALYVGSTRPNKNLPNMIHAFAQAVRQTEEYPAILDELQLVLVVSPDRFFRECRQLIRRLGIQERVKVYHRISDLEKRVFYRHCRALYFVSKYEGFGFPLLEAQACGVPALVANHSALPEIAGESALIVDPDSIDEIATGLIRIVSDEALRETLIAAGQANARHYKWERTARRVLEFYRHLYA